MIFFKKTKKTTFLIIGALIVSFAAHFDWFKGDGKHVTIITSDKNALEQSFIEKAHADIPSSGGGGGDCGEGGDCS